MNNNELTRMLQVLTWYIGDGQSYFGRGSSRPLRTPHEFLAQRHPPMTDGHLKSYRQTEEADLDYFIHGRPIEKGSPTLYPVARVKWAIRPAGLSVGFRVGLFAVDKGNTITSSRGWRFETPSCFDYPDTDETDDKAATNGATADATDIDGAEPAGLHDYYHAQAIGGWDKATELPELVKPINTTQPAFRLMAHDAPSLVTSAIVSLYGLADHLMQPKDLPGFPAEALQALRPVQSSGGTSLKKKGK